MRAPVAITLFVTPVFLSACGGGGEAISTSITAISPQQPVTGQPASFTGTASGPAGATLSYSWNFGDGGSAAGATASHTYSARGTYQVNLTANDGQGHTGNASRSVTVNAPPVTPTVTASPAAPKPGDLVTLTVASSDPEGNALSYTWDLGDGATASGTAVTHTYAEGVYTVKVTAADATLSLSSSGQMPLTVTYPPPSAPVIYADASAHYVGQILSLSASATDPDGLAITYGWSFGDGGSTTGTQVTHAYATAGTYTVTATATNSDGKSATSSAAVLVLAATTPVVAANSFVPLCAGPLCGAADASSYSGKGVGAWIYSNNTASPATINIKLAGVTASDRVALIFSNGQSTTAAQIPSAGTLAAGSAAPVARHLTDRVQARRQSEAAAHTMMLLRNHDLAVGMLAVPRTPAPQAAPVPRAAPRPHAVPAVGTTRTWYDLFDQDPGVPYSTTLVFSCPLPTGRNMAFWLDPNAKTQDGVTDSDLTQLEGIYCGDQGGYAQLTGLLGDVWGPGAAQYSSYLIQDTPTLQDVNIVIPAVPAITSWGGYFYGKNNFLQSDQAGSNQALVFFINGANLHGNVQYYASTLLHESTHMINYYQRTIVLGNVHDSWLEETSAMMTEDIVVPAVDGGYTDIPGRISDYVGSGGAVSYINWQQLQNSDYGLGGSFGAFLNRRYGLAIYQQLIIGCPDGGSTSSYTCLDALIARNGGIGFADEFARMGATVFAGVPSSGTPWGLGYAATAAGQYSLPGLIAPAAGTPASLNGTYTATTHTYQLDKGAAGYERDQVVIPPQTSLIVIVQPGS